MGKTRPDAEFLRRLRQVVGDNATDFARKIDISQPSLHGYISGKYAPGFEFFFALASHGIDVNWLLTGKRGAIGRKNVNIAENEVPETVRNAQKIAILLSKIPRTESAFAMKAVETLIQGVTRKNQRG